jgi:NAD(P)H-dependent FMN reductase
MPSKQCFLWFLPARSQWHPGGKFLLDQLAQRGHTTVFADAMEYDFGLLDRMYKEYEPGQAPAKMEELAEHIRTADGFVVVTGEYNHSILPG